jgi:hypothetical protein
MKPVLRPMIVVLAAAMLSACATLSMPDYPAAHPASPEAAATVAPAASSALDTYRPASAMNGNGARPAPKSAEQPESGGGHDHH